MTTRTYRAGAFLEAAERLGVPVVVGSDRPQVLSAANPGGNLTLDFTSPEKASQRIVEFSKEYPIQALVSADDDGAILAAMASEALGLEHNSVGAVSVARNKYEMRQTLGKADIPSPSFGLFSIDDDPAGIGRGIRFPCVVKPLSLSASRGVIRADNAEQFATAFVRLATILQKREADANGGESGKDILVEDFIPGVEVALEGLLSKGKLKTLAIFDKPDPLDGPFFEETIYVTPSRLPPSKQEEIASSTAEAAGAIGLGEGPVHAELRVNDKGVWIIEIAPRSIGGLCSRTLRFGYLSEGEADSEGAVSLEELILRHAMRLETESFVREKVASGVMMIPIPQSGILREVGGKEEAEDVTGIEEVRITIPLGSKVVPLPEGARYLGFIFARDETPEKVEAALREAHRRLKFVITA